MAFTGSASGPRSTNSQERAEASLSGAAPGPSLPPPCSLLCCRPAPHPGSPPSGLWGGPPSPGDSNPPFVPCLVPGSGWGPAAPPCSRCVALLPDINIRCAFREPVSQVLTTVPRDEHTKRVPRDRVNHLLQHPLAP